MKRLIVNADDFGLSAGVNRAILEAHIDGILTSATLLANGAAFEEAVQLARETPQLGVGIHLNLTEGPPICDPARIPRLVRGDGKFAASPARLAVRLLSGKASLAEVESEWRAQIEKVLAAGLQPMHLDGHKHIHMLPMLFALAARLAREHGISGVRCAAESAGSLGEIFRRGGADSITMLKQFFKGRALAAVSTGSRERLRRMGLRSPDYFFGITQTGLLDTASLERLLEALPEGTSELMCHPGYADAALRATPTRLVEQRERELTALISAEARRRVAESGIQLIHYGGLAGTP